jgi:hypothetical protein
VANNVRRLKRELSRASDNELVTRLRDIAAYLKSQTWSEIVPDMGLAVDEAADRMERVWCGSGE